MNEPKAKSVMPGSVTTFAQSLTIEYPELHLEKTHAALVLAISPAPTDVLINGRYHDDGTIVVAHFDSKNTNLINMAISTLDGMSGIVDMKVIAPEKNDLVKQIQEFCLSLSKGKITLRTNQEHVSVFEQANACTVRFNQQGKLTIMPLKQPKPTSFLDAIRNTLLSPFRSCDPLAKDEDPATKSQPPSSSPPKVM